MYLGSKLMTYMRYLSQSIDCEASVQHLSLEKDLLMLANFWQPNQVLARFMQFYALNIRVYLCVGGTRESRKTKYVRCRRCGESNGAKDAIRTQINLGKKKSVKKSVTDYKIYGHFV